jgi:hypothetical protein
LHCCSVYEKIKIPSLLHCHRTFCATGQPLQFGWVFYYMENLLKLENEVWVDVLDYEGLYMVSNYGRVYSLIKKIIRKPVLHKNGYQQIMLSNKSNVKLILVHRLVLMSFIGRSELEVDHINNIKTDNRLENLRYCTRRENEWYKIKPNKTSKYIGVRKFRNKWRSHISINKKNIHIGTFNTEIEAYNAYLNLKKQL